MRQFRREMNKLIIIASVFSTIGILYLVFNLNAGVAKAYDTGNWCGTSSNTYDVGKPIATGTMEWRGEELVTAPPPQLWWKNETKKVVVRTYYKDYDKYDTHHHDLEEDYYIQHWQEEMKTYYYKEYYEEEYFQNYKTDYYHFTYDSDGSCSHKHLDSTYNGTRSYWVETGNSRISSGVNDMGIKQNQYNDPTVYGHITQHNDKELKGTYGTYTVTVTLQSNVLQTDKSYNWNSTTITGYTQDYQNEHVKTYRRDEYDNLVQDQTWEYWSYPTGYMCDNSGPRYGNCNWRNPNPSPTWPKKGNPKWVYSTHHDTLIKEYDTSVEGPHTQSTTTYDALVKSHIFDHSTTADSQYQDPTYSQDYETQYWHTMQTDYFKNQRDKQTWPVYTYTKTGYQCGPPNYSPCHFENPSPQAHSYYYTTPQPDPPYETKRWTVTVEGPYTKSTTTYDVLVQKHIFDHSTTADSQYQDPTYSQDYETQYWHTMQTDYFKDQRDKQTWPVYTYTKTGYQCGPPNYATCHFESPTVLAHSYYYTTPQPDPPYETKRWTVTVEGPHTQTTHTYYTPWQTTITNVADQGSQPFKTESVTHQPWFDLFTVYLQQHVHDVQQRYKQTWTEYDYTMTGYQCGQPDLATCHYETSVMTDQTAQKQDANPHVVTLGQWQDTLGITALNPQTPWSLATSNLYTATMTGIAERKNPAQVSVAAEDGSTVSEAVSPDQTALQSISVSTQPASNSVSNWRDSFTVTGSNNSQAPFTSPWSFGFTTPSAEVLGSQVVNQTFTVQLNGTDPLGNPWNKSFTFAATVDPNLANGLRGILIK